MILSDGFVSGCIVKGAAKRIYDAGGCDAEDEYSQGYDDAITLALDILLGEIGYMIEDILDYEEDKGAGYYGNRGYRCQDNREFHIVKDTAPQLRLLLFNGYSRELDNKKR